MLSIKENAFGIVVQREFLFPFSNIKCQQDFLAGKINDLNKTRGEHENIKAYYKEPILFEASYRDKK